MPSIYNHAPWPQIEADMREQGYDEDQIRDAKAKYLEKIVKPSAEWAAFSDEDKAQIQDHFDPSKLKAAGKEAWWKLRKGITELGASVGQTLIGAPERAGLVEPGSVLSDFNKELQQQAASEEAEQQSGITAAKQKIGGGATGKALDIATSIPAILPGVAKYAIPAMIGTAVAGPAGTLAGAAAGAGLAGGLGAAESYGAGAPAGDVAKRAAEETAMMAALGGAGALTRGIARPLLRIPAQMAATEAAAATADVATKAASEGRLPTGQDLTQAIENAAPLAMFGGLHSALGLRGDAKARAERQAAQDALNQQKAAADEAASNSAATGGQNVQETPGGGIPDSESNGKEPVTAGPESGGGESGQAGPEVTPVASPEVRGGPVSAPPPDAQAPLGKDKRTVVLKVSDYMKQQLAEKGLSPDQIAGMNFTEAARILAKPVGKSKMVMPPEPSGPPIKPSTGQLVDLPTEEDKQNALAPHVIGEVPQPFYNVTGINPDPNLPVLLVNGDAIANKINADYNQGANDQEDKGRDFVPKSTILVSAQDDNPPAVMLHEVYEQTLMRIKGWDYDKAHEAANAVESVFRQTGEVAPAVTKFINDHPAEAPNGKAIAPPKGIPLPAENRIELRINTPINDVAARTLMDGSQDPELAGLARHLGAVAVSVDPPYSFDLSQNGAVTKDGTIRLNPNAGPDIMRTYGHELGHLAYYGMEGKNLETANKIIEKNQPWLRKNSPGYVGDNHESFADLVGVKRDPEAIALAMKANADLIPKERQSSEAIANLPQAARSVADIQARSYGNGNLPLAADDNFAAIQREVPDASVRVKDVNGGRHSIPISEFIKWTENPVIEANLREAYLIPPGEPRRIDTYTVKGLPGMQAEIDKARLGVGTRAAKTLPQPPPTALPGDPHAPPSVATRTVGGQPPPPNPAIPPTPVPPATKADILNVLTNDIGFVIHNEGKAKTSAQSTVGAVYDRGPQAARTFFANNPTIAIHEFGHDLTIKHPDIMAKINSDPVMKGEMESLGRISYPGGVPPANIPLAEEGFSEFMLRKAAMGDAAQLAPRTNEWFTNDFLKKKGRASLAAGIDKLQDTTARWAQSVGFGNENVIAPQGTQSGRESQFPSSVQNAQAYLRNNAVTQSLKATIEKSIGRTLNPEEDVDKILRGNMMTSGITARNFLLNGPTRADGRPFEFDGRKVGGLPTEIGNVITSALGPKAKQADIKRAESDIYHYAAAMREVTQEQRLGPDMETAWQSKASRGAFLARIKADPKRFAMVEAGAKSIRAWNAGLLQYGVDKGSLSPEDMTRMLSENPYYVPMQRIVETPGSQNPLQRFQGSSRTLRNVTDSEADMARYLIRKADRAEVLRAIVNFADKAPVGMYVHQMEAKTPETTRVFVNGEYREYVLDPLLKRAVDTMSGTNNPDTVARVLLGGPRKMMTLMGVSLNPTSTVLRPLRAALQQVFNAPTFGEAAHAPIDAATGLLDVMRASKVLRRVWSGVGGTLWDTDPMFQRYRAAGVRAGSLVGMDKTKAQMGAEISGIPEMPAVKTISSMADYGKALGAFFRPFDRMREAQLAADDMQRGPAFRRAFDAAYNDAKSRGQSEDVAQYAGWVAGRVAARDIGIDHSNYGDHATLAWLGNAIPFFNASRARTSSFARRMKADPVGASLRALAMISLPAAALELMHSKDDWYQNIPDYEKSNFLHFKLGDQVYRIPLPFISGKLFGRVIPMAIAKELQGLPPDDFVGALKHLALDFSPTGTNPFDLSSPQAFGLHTVGTAALLRPLAELMANEDAQTGRTIIPQHMKDMMAEEQYHPTTSPFYRVLASLAQPLERTFPSLQKTPIASPLALQHVMEGYGGGVQRSVANLVKKMDDTQQPQQQRKSEAADLPFAGALVSRQLRPGQPVDDLYTKWQQAETVQKTINGKIKNQDIGGARIIMAQNRDLLARLPLYREAVKAIQQLRQINDIPRQTEIARRALGKGIGLTP